MTLVLAPLRRFYPACTFRQRLLRAGVGTALVAAPALFEAGELWPTFVLQPIAGMAALQDCRPAR